MGAPLLVVLCTVPDFEVAQRLARAFIDERLVACVNIMPGLTSVYRWEGAVQQEVEVLMLLKTTPGRLAELEARLHELHPYAVPEFVVLDAARVAPLYHAWSLRMTE